MPNLSREIEKRLPAELAGFMKSAGAIANYQGQRLHLVGGVVRDLLLGRPNLDLDLVVEGDATSLARQMANIVQSKITTHSRFNTAKLRWHEWSIDIATARSETYSRPGALPRVRPGTLADDLFRRDFTINTMAVRLNPGRYGEMIDLYGGRDDLERGIIRVLHEKSFTDDATRIWRGLRYEQRFDFHIEPETLKLLRRDIPMLDTISRDRLRHELELVLKEEYPEKVLRRADNLKVLPGIHPSLKGNGWLARNFKRARQTCSPEPPPVALYLALLTCRLSGNETEQIISEMIFPGVLARTLRDSNSLKNNIEVLSNPRLSPSSVYSALQGYSPVAITAHAIASDSPVVRQHMNRFLSRLRYIRPALTGDDLMRLGIPPGPQIKEVLTMLLNARLDGKVTGKKQEEAMARNWLRLHT
jgi:tRNA nucleotidyltransferase (CCA-adding enzyme)